MIKIFANEHGFSVPIGRQGETGTRAIVFDLHDWQAELGEGVPGLIVMRPGDLKPYPAPLEVSGSSASWTVGLADTYVSGSGKMELQYVIDNRIAKSKTYDTFVEKSLEAPGEPPAPPEQAFLDKVIANAARAETAAGRAEEAMRAAAAAANTAVDAKESASQSEALVAQNTSVVVKSAGEVKSMTEEVRRLEGSARTSAGNADESEYQAKEAAKAAAASQAAAAESEKVSGENKTASEKAAQSAAGSEAVVAENANKAEAAAGAAAGHAANAAQSETNAKGSEEKAASEAQRATQNILNGVDAHNKDHASHPFLLEEVSRVESIAKGRNFAQVFNTEEEMDNWLLLPENVATLEVGTNLYIRDLGVPDYWWDGTEAQVLEVDAPDLSEYVTKVQLSMSLPIAIHESDYAKLEQDGKLIPGRIYYVVPDGQPLEV